MGKVCRGYSIQVSFLHEDKKWGHMLLENSLKECCQLYGPLIPLLQPLFLF